MRTAPGLAIHQTWMASRMVALQLVRVLRERVLRALDARRLQGLHLRFERGGLLAHDPQGDAHLEGAARDVRDLEADGDQGADDRADREAARRDAGDTEMPVGDILGIAEGSASALPPPPQENAPLKLVRSGKALAYGHLGRVGDQFAFVIE